jgi:transcriptional/translational regulatory protein YebC/TACO1
MRNKKEKEKENKKKKVLKIKTFTAKRGGRMDAKKCVFFFFTNYYTLI